MNLQIPRDVSLMAVKSVSYQQEDDFSGIQYDEEEMLIWGLHLLLERLGGRQTEPQHYFQKPAFHEGKTIGQVSNQLNKYFTTGG